MSKVDVHKKICEELTTLYARKNADYGDSFAKSFKEYGLTMACIRLEDKLNRIKALRDKTAQVNDESITDTLMDLANYAIMTLVEMRQEDPVVKVAAECAVCQHDPQCMRDDPKCQCNKCANDCHRCCVRDDHIALNCPMRKCPDFVPEEG